MTITSDSSQYSKTPCNLTRKEILHGGEITMEVRRHAPKGHKDLAACCLNYMGDSNAPQLSEIVSPATPNDESMTHSHCHMSMSINEAEILSKER